MIVTLCHEMLSWNIEKNKSLAISRNGAPFCSLLAYCANKQAMCGTLQLAEKEVFVTFQGNEVTMFLDLTVSYS